jgi:predicted peptidase
MNHFWFSVLAAGCALGLGMARVRADDKPKQTAQSFEKPVTIIVKLNYLLYLPPKYETSEEKWPLVVFLHGAGETGNDLKMVKKHGPPKLVEKKEFPFILVSPQAPVRGWVPEAVNALIDDVMAHYRVDADRVYLTGLSMGGYGTWALAAAYPGKFAAAVPICGGGNPSVATKLKNLPLWVFHGGKDTTVLPIQSKTMVEAVKKAGGNVKFTIYPEAGHDSWTEAYDDPELWRWLLSQQRGKAELNPKTIQD